MRKTLISTLCVLLIHSSAYAQNSQTAEANSLPSDWPAGMNDFSNYLGTNVVPLSPQEKKALRLTNNWTAKGVEPVLSAGGKLIYVHGASTPTVIASPMQVCDVELQAGEIVNEIIVGDSARWILETGQSANATHIFVKPMDTGLETSAVITTNRRVYHLRLISQKNNFTPYIGFTYANDLRVYTANQQKKQEKEEEFKTTTMQGQSLANLNFEYKVTGNASWKPKRVYDNGQQTFIRLANNTKSNEMPILLVRKGNENILVNYRVKDQAMIMDGIFEEIVLIIGAGNNKEQILIKKLS